MRILLITISERPWTLYRDANEYLIQIEDTKNLKDWKDLDLNQGHFSSMYHKFTEQNYPDLNVVVKEYSEGYHKNTVYRVKLFLPVLFLPPVTLPFYTCKQFQPVYIART